MEAKGAFIKLREQRRFDEAMNGYLEWITRAGTLFERKVCFQFII